MDPFNSGRALTIRMHKWRETLTFFIDLDPESLTGFPSVGIQARAPTDPYVPSQAYGSSRQEFATGRHTEWIAIGGGSGCRSSIRVN